MRPELAKMFPGAAYGEQWTPEYEQALHQFAAQLGVGSGGQQRNMVVSPGSAVVDPATGNVVYERPFAPARGQLVEVPDGQGGTIQMEYDSVTRQLNMPQYPGQPRENRDAFDQFIAPIAADAETSGRPLTGAEFMELYRQYQANGPGGISVRAGQPTPGAGGFAPQGGSYAPQAGDTSPQGGGFPPQAGVQIPQGGGLGRTPPKPNTNQARLLSPQEVAQAGLPAGTVAQMDGNGTLTVVHRPEKPAGENDGLNDRQRVAVKGVQRNLIAYASALTGLSQEDLSKLSAQDIADEIANKGGRVVQGGLARTMTRLPWGDLAVQNANSDVTSYSQGAGAAWAAYENPTGIITNADRETATAQMPNPLDPVEVQATKIKNFLDLSGWDQQRAPHSSTAPQSSRQNSPQALLEAVSDADLMRMLNGGQ